MSALLTADELRAVATIAEALGPAALDDARTVEVVNAGTGVASVAVLGEYAPKWRALAGVVGDGSGLERHDIERPELFRLRTPEAPAADPTRTVGFSYAGRFVWDADLDLVDVPPSEMRRMLEAQRIADFGYVDALMLLVFADSQVTKQERDFLLEFCARFPATPLAIVVSDLNRVPELEQQAVRARLQRQGNALGARVRVFIESDTQAAGARASGYLRDLTGRFDPRGDRALRALWLSDALRRLVTRVESRARLGGPDPVDLDLILDRLVVRGRRCVQGIREYMARERELLVTDLVDALVRAPDPNVFWLDVLPQRLRGELMTRALRVEGAIREDVRGDVAWLQEELRSSYGSHVELERPTVLMRECRVPDLSRLGLDHNERVTWLASLGSASIGAATPLVDSVWHVNISTVEALGDLVSQRYRSLKHRESRGSSVPVLESLLRQAVDEMAETESARIESLYAEVTEQARAVAGPARGVDAEAAWAAEATEVLSALATGLNRRIGLSKGDTG